MLKRGLTGLLVIALCIAAGGWSAVQAADAPVAGSAGSGSAAMEPVAGQADAYQLIDSARRALSQVVRAAESDRAVPPSDVKAKPFWNALKTLNDSLARAETSARLKSFRK